jgi:hypothetical protein
MFIDIWIVSLFSLLFGICAVINFRLGVNKGVQGTLTFLADQKIISVVDDEVVPYKRERLRRRKKDV